MVSASRRWRGCFLALLVTAVAATGCANPHVAALNQYNAGDPAAAENTMAPLLAKDDKNAILYLWDVGMFRFAQGNCRGANEAWMRTGELANVEPGALETSFELFKSDASKRFVGDPVEYAMAFLYVGLGYYTMGDYENAMVAFKKSLEWDYSGEAERRGDMVITNMMLGECYARRGESDQAIVAYRRALRGSPGCIPAQIGLLRHLTKAGKSNEAVKVRAELSEKMPEAYVAAVDQFEQGVLAIIMSGHAPKVKKDAFLGAFRVRSEVSTPIHHWQVSCVGGPEGIPVNRADALITHFKDQGGESGQALRKGAQVAAATVMQQVPILGLFAPKVEADVRYWSTLPGDVCVAYLPTEPGLHTVRATAFDKKNRGLDNYRQTWYYIPVSPEENTVLVIISHGDLHALM